MKLTAPLLSTWASGTLAHMLTYQQTANGAIARRKPTSKLLQSPATLSNQRMIAYLSKLWHYIPPAYKTIWEQENRSKSKTTYAFYLATNIRRWNAGLGPIWHPTAPPRTQPFGITVMTLLPIAENVRIAVTPHNTGVNFTVIIHHREDPAEPPDQDNAKAIYRLYAGHLYTSLNAKYGHTYTYTARAYELTGTLGQEEVTKTLAS
jgi:hypothetical protein